MDCIPPPHGASPNCKPPLDSATPVTLGATALRSSPQSTRTDWCCPTSGTMAQQPNPAISAPFHPHPLTHRLPAAGRRPTVSICHFAALRLTRTPSPPRHPPVGAAQRLGDEGRQLWVAPRQPAAGRHAVGLVLELGREDLWDEGTRRGPNGPSRRSTPSTSLLPRLPHAGGVHCFSPAPLHLAHHFFQILSLPAPPPHRINSPLPSSPIKSHPPTPTW